MSCLRSMTIWPSTYSFTHNSVVLANGTQTTYSPRVQKTSFYHLSSIRLLSVPPWYFRSLRYHWSQHPTPKVQPGSVYRHCSPLHSVISLFLPCLHYSMLANSKSSSRICHPTCVVLQGSVLIPTCLSFTLQHSAFSVDYHTYMHTDDTQL